MDRAIPHGRVRNRAERRKDYTRVITLVAAGALCSAFWIAVADAVVHAVRR
jgi:cytochrome bd-type quinol oxidase subunit 1